MQIRFGRRAGIGTLAAMAVALAFVLQPAPVLAQGGGGGGHFEEYGNNLSFPVIWAEGTTKTLRGTFGDVQTEGEWMFWWGTDEDTGDPLSCVPDDFAIPGGCADGQAPGPGAIRVYEQKDEYNVWQAESLSLLDPATGTYTAPVAVDWIDWGDNLESVDWYDKSMVRTELVLFKDLGGAFPGMLEYGMRHLDGWGIDEVHGLATVPPGNTPEVLDGAQATVYSNCARLTIQKLLTDREDPDLAALAWNPGTGEWEGALIRPAIFNKTVWESGDGPGYYSAEINVKGRVIYGYTWNVRQLNDDDPDAGGVAAGDYRVTFSLDGLGCPTPLNAFFVEGTTSILLSSEEEEAVTEEEPLAGAVPVLDFTNNLTYADVRILSRSGGKVKIKIK